MVYPSDPGLLHSVESSLCAGPVRLGPECRAGRRSRTRTFGGRSDDVEGYTQSVVKVETFRSHLGCQHVSWVLGPETPGVCVCSVFDL